jgi:hypothetical protein
MEPIGMLSKAHQRLAALLLAAALGLVAGSASAAVSVVNRDDKDHKLTVIEEKGAKITEHVLKPSQVLEGFCEQGCVIRLNDSDQDEYELTVGDKVSIEEGYLYYEETEAAPGAAPAAPDAVAPKAEAPKKQ